MRNVIESHRNVNHGCDARLNRYTQYELHEGQAKRYNSSSKKSHLHSIRSKKKKKNTGPPRNKTCGGAPDTSSNCIKTKKEKKRKLQCRDARCGLQSQPVDVIITLLTVPMHVAHLSVTPKLNAAEKMKSSKKEEEKHLVTPNPLLVIVVYLKIGKAK
jgi:hypothetical protein